MPFNFRDIASSAAKKALAGISSLKPDPMSRKQFEAMEEKIVTPDEQRQAKRQGKKQAKKNLPFSTFKQQRIAYPDLDKQGKLDRLAKIQAQYLKQKNPKYYSTDELEKRTRPPTAQSAANWAKNNPATPKETRKYERLKDK